MTTADRIASGVTEKILTHEVGAGAPCLKCGDKCPGLDLHFWRKICKNCKCKQENHDVLASVSTRGIDNIGKLLMQDKEANQATGQLDKAPSPESRSPEKTSPKTVTASTEPPPPAPKPAKHTSNADHNVTPTQNGGISQSQPNKTGNYNFSVEIGDKAHTLDFGINDADFSFPAPPELKQEDVDDFPAPPPPEPELPPVVPPLPQEFQDAVVIKDDSNDPSSYENIVEARETPPSVNTQITDVVAQKTHADKLKQDLDSIPSLSDDEDVEYDWNPPISDKKLIESYIEALPKDKQPVVGTEGAKYRKKQLMRQLPTHDQEPNECHDLTPQETQEMQLFVKQYREKALGVAKVEENSKVKSCAECRNPLTITDPIVWAERMGQERHWHPGCFVCAECKELLVDLIYFYHEDKIYCGRHYCELQKPRCAACDELIFAPEYTQAEDSYWHLKHFCCWHCDQPLGGKNYVPHDNQPVCIPCYEKTFAHTCSTCKQIIAPNTEWVTFENHHWHAQAECFKCTQCSQSLVGKPCIPKGDMVFCCSKCKREKFPPGQ
ncbi:unnamed protein product [Clavelina lepadiformis]|uniref:Testin n=1 Tax=Clavelina lepadiformis TaxID=159417 RepID=A0ABP0H439_CLALP